MSEVDIYQKLTEIEEAPRFSMIFGESSDRSDKISEHRLWLQNIRKEHPLPATPYRVGVYIRYFNQTKYKNHHEAIISRDDFIATQRMLDNAKFGNKSILPELRVIDDGILKGFVTINPRWAGFKEFDYYQAAKSVYDPDDIFPEEEEIEFSVEAGDFDLRGFEVTRSEFLNQSANLMLFSIKRESSSALPA